MNKNFYYLLLSLMILGIRFGFCESKKLKIISITPSTTEILFSLGLDEEIVGVTSYCNYPEKAIPKEKVGTFSQPSIEKILSLEPDIVFATGLEQASFVEKLKKLGLNVYICDPSNLKELFVCINTMGKLTGKEKESEILVQSMKNKINGIVSQVSKMPHETHPKVFVEIWNDPLMTAGKGSFVDELISLAGGVNIAQDVTRPYSRFSSEQVIKRNPDVILLGYMDPKSSRISFAKRLGWKNVNAVKNDRIIGDINPDLFFRPGPRLADGLEQIFKKLHNL